MKPTAIATLPDVSRETAERLDILHSLVLRWNRTINLIARGDEPHLVARHILDSLHLRRHIAGPPPRAIDLGSGAGFPGLVLALATGIHFDLIESDVRKAAFLREAIRATAASASVHCHRIEGCMLPPAPLITARALAPVAQLLAWSEHLRTTNSVCLFPKGRTAEQELTQAREQWHMRVEAWPNPQVPAAHILRLSEISRV